MTATTPRSYTELLNLSGPDGGYLRVSTRRAQGWSHIVGDAYRWSPDADPTPTWQGLWDRVLIQCSPAEQDRLVGGWGSSQPPSFYVPERFEGLVAKTILNVPAHWQYGAWGQHTERVLTGLALW